MSSRSRVDTLGGPPSSPLTGLVIVLGVLVVVALIVLIALLTRLGDGQDLETVDTVSTTAAATLPTSSSQPTSVPSSSTTGTASTVSTVASTSATTPTTSTTGSTVSTTTTSTTTTSSSSTASTTTTIDPRATASAVWPFAGSSIRYDDPVEAARGFAEDYLGVADPALGPFLAGDGRSGEVELRPVPDGQATTVFVRQLAGDSWWVLGAATDDIEVDRPGALEVIDSPVEVTGRGRPGDGPVRAELRADGFAILDDDVVIPAGGGGAEPVAFSTALAFTTPDEAAGAVVLTSTDVDGEVLGATVVRIRFAATG